MMPSSTLLLLKLGASLLLCLSAGLLVYGFAVAPDSWLRRATFRYIASLERSMRAMFIETKGSHIVLGQLVFAVLAGAGYLLTQIVWFLALLPLIAMLPGLVLDRMRRRRVQRIEAKLDGFVLALANALRATPSPGRALAMVQPVTAAPLDREIELVLREMRVGSTLEQTLLNMSARVTSYQLDAALCGLLIGRQSGGNVPQILDSTAETLREMNRLAGVLRAKTAEGRAQAQVLAFLPAAILFAFDAVSPGYFRPLTESASGLMVTMIATGMWISSVVLARKILQVEL